MFSLLFSPRACAVLAAAVLAPAAIAASAPNDPLFNLQWGLKNTGQTVPNVTDDVTTLVTGAPGVDINVLKAWDVTRGSATVIVGIIDENDLDVQHPDLRTQVYVNPGEIPNDGIDNDHNGYVDDVSGWNFRENRPMGQGFDHATHIGGIIAARSGNSLGVTGVAPGVKILPLSAGTNETSFLDAIAYAKRLGVRIINCSQGGFDHSSTASYNAIRDSGMIFVCAAGNKGTAKYLYPAGYDLPNIISVASVDNAGVIALSSNYGEGHVDIAAPGKGIMSTFPNSAYEYDNGTSMAAPHVAATCALLLSKFPTMTNDQIIARILKTGMTLPTLKGAVKSGAMLDAAAALTDTAALGLNGVAQSSSVALSWTAQSGASRYDLEVDGAVVNVALATNYAHSGLAPESAHIYRVRAVTGSTPGLWSSRVFKRATKEPTNEAYALQSSHPYSANQSKTYVVSKRNAKRIRVHFSKIDILPNQGDSLYYGFAVGDSDPEFNSFTGLYPTGFWTHWQDGYFTFHFDTDASGNAYGFAVDRIEYLTGIPDQPIAPFVSQQPSATSVELYIDASPGSTDVIVYRATSANGTYSKIATKSIPTGTSGLLYTNSGLTARGTYYYKVSSKNDLGESPKSDAAVVTLQ